MKKCPYCHNKITESICTYCGNDTSTFDELILKKRQLRMALVQEELDSIKELSLDILNLDSNSFYGKYYLAYVNYVKKQEHDLEKLLTEKVDIPELDEICNHLLTHNLFEEEIKAFLKINGRAFLLEQKPKEELLKELIPRVQIKYNFETNTRKIFGYIFLSFGIFLWLIFSLLGILIVPDLRSSATILLLIMPSICFNKSLEYLLNFKKGILFFSFILIWLIISYISLLGVNTNIILHLRNVFCSLYDFIMYYVRKAVNV